MSVRKLSLPAGRKAAGEGGGHWAESISSEFSIQIEAPIKKILRRLRDRGIISRIRPWPIHVACLTSVSDGEIVLRQPLSSQNDCRLPDPLVCNIHPSHKHKSSARNIILKYSKDLKIVNKEGGKTLAEFPNSIELGKLGPVGPECLFSLYNANAFLKVVHSAYSIDSVKTNSIHSKTSTASRWPFPSWKRIEGGAGPSRLPDLNLPAAEDHQKMTRQSEQATATLNQSMNEKKALTEGEAVTRLIRRGRAQEGKGVIPPPIRPDERSTELHPYSPGPCTSLSPGAFPRYRYDQLMGLGRKVFLPLSLARSPFNGSLNYVQGISLLSNGKRASPRKCPFSLGHLLWLIVKSSAVGISALLSQERDHQGPQKLALGAVREGNEDGISSLMLMQESNGSPIALAVIAFDSRRFGVKESTIAILGANQLRRHRAYSSKKVFSSPLLLSNLKTERTSSLYFSIDHDSRSSSSSLLVAGPSLQA
uniref:Uncharacterized protein n=1 Tax=Salix viminalis TaxID=40686 RepID=A0A6N2KMP0_SALVM